VEVRFCPRCGASRLPGAMFCGTCGFGFGSLEPGRSDPVVPAAGTPVDDRLAGPPSPPPAVPVVTVTPPPAPPGGTSPPTANLRSGPGASAGARPAGAVAPPRDLSATASLGRVRTRRRVVDGFARGGAVLAGAGLLLAVTGVPRPAGGLGTVGSGGTLDRLLDYLPLLAVVVLVVLGLASVAAWKRDVIEAAPALAVTGATGIGVIVLGLLSAARLGYDAAGEVLPAVSLVVAGGASLLAAAVVGVLVRE
jgi:hypothetical protein